MRRGLRTLARRLLGVRRTPTYYLPWLSRPGLECTLLLSNVEARFRADASQGPFAAAVVQYDAHGAVVGRYDVTLADTLATAELTLRPAPGGYGLVTVNAPRIHSDLYVTLSDGETYTATHGRQEFVETYPAWTRALLGALGQLAARTGRTLPLFAKDQYLYAGADSRSHLLVLNLADVTNRVRVSLNAEQSRPRARLLVIPPRGAHLFDVGPLGAGAAPAVVRAHLEGNAWFNFYLVGAGPRDLAGPLSLMHVK